MEKNELIKKYEDYQKKINDLWRSLWHRRKQNKNKTP